MGTWLAEQNADVHYTRFYRSSALPSIEALDLLRELSGTTGDRNNDASEKKGAQHGKNKN
jgi:hypothetical protein